MRNDEPSEPLIPSSIPIRRNDVYDLKVRLTELGFYKGPVDDVYDDAAVNGEGLSEEPWLIPDGVVEKTTWRALGHGVRPLTAELQSWGRRQGDRRRHLTLTLQCLLTDSPGGHIRSPAEVRLTSSGRRVEDR